MNYSTQKKIHHLKVREGSELPEYIAEYIHSACPVQAHILPSLRSLQGEGLKQACPTSRIALVLNAKPCFLQPLMDPQAQITG